MSSNFQGSYVSLPVLQRPYRDSKYEVQALDPMAPVLTPIQRPIDRRLILRAEPSFNLNMGSWFTVSHTVRAQEL